MGNVLISQNPPNGQWSDGPTCHFRNLSVTFSLVTACIHQLFLVCVGLSVCGAQGSAQLHLQLSLAPEGPHV